MATRINALKISQLADLHMEGINRLRNMWLDPRSVFYEDEIVPGTMGDSTCFLAGPSSRDGIPDYMWRKDARFYLRKFNYHGRLIIPEPRGYSYLSERQVDFTNKSEIPKWERKGLRTATFILFWIPRNREQLLALTTNREIGQWMGKAEHDPEINRRLFIGWPSGAVNMGSLQNEIEEGKIGYLEGGHYGSLKEMCQAAAKVYGDMDDDIPF